MNAVTDRLVSRFGRQHAIVRTFQPLYGLGLRAVYGRRGLPWRVNGDLFRIDPAVRRLVPHESETALFHFLRDNIRPGHIVFDIGSFLETAPASRFRDAGVLAALGDWLHHTPSHELGRSVSLLQRENPWPASA